MIDFPILSLLTFLPLVGVLFILLIRGDEARVSQNSRRVALYTTAFNFILSLYLLLNFDGESADFQFTEVQEWFPALGINYHMGVDGISLFFVLLATPNTNDNKHRN